MIKVVKGKDNLVVKRDGRTEPWSYKKAYRAVLWMCEGKKSFADELMESITIKIHNKITITKFWDEVIETAANKISEMYPFWDTIARNGYILKIYKESFNMSDDTSPRQYLGLIQKGMQSTVYSKKTLNYFTDAEILEIAEFFQYDRDWDYSFIGLVTMMGKSCFKYSKTKMLELPQHTYMRMAIEGFYKETDKTLRLKLIKKRYDYLSTFIVTEASPKVSNSLTNEAQLASCVLSEVDDNTPSISYTDTNLAEFSRYGGGLATNIGALRCKGSSVGKKGGVSSGPIPMIQKFQATVTAFDQQGKRPGACVITFPFWHMDVRDLLMLKDAGGSPDTRARKMQYTMQWYKILTTRIREAGTITLFDPKEVPDLLKLWGQEFEDKYIEYENKSGIKKTIIEAQDLGFLATKIRSETGNLYIVFPDNVNAQRIGEEPVYASNLCCEVFLPVRPAKNFKNKLMIDFDTDQQEIHSKADVGEIALCNLSSINVVKWMKLTNIQKHELMYNLLRASDNMIDTQFYPVLDGAVANKTRRPIGVGVSNYANYLASKKCLFTDERAKQLTHELFEDIHYYTLFASNQLAKERGAYKYFKDSNWAKGLLPMDFSLVKDKDGYNFELKHDWIQLRQDIVNHGVRFSYHHAIAPTATSGLIVNSTEGVEPIKTLFTMKEGTYTLPAIVPDLKKNRQYYQKAFDIPNTTLNTLNAIRQKFIDQGQSMSHYYKITDSSYTIMTDIMDAEEKGLKSLYYLQPMKAGDHEACESCSS